MSVFCFSQRNGGGNVCRTMLYSDCGGRGQSWVARSVQTASCSPSWRRPLFSIPALVAHIPTMPWESDKSKRAGKLCQPMCQRQAPTLHCLPQQQSLQQHLEQEVIAHNITWRCIYSDNEGGFEWNGNRSTSPSVFLPDLKSHLAAEDTADLFCRSIAVGSICVSADAAPAVLRCHVYHQAEKE